MADVVVAGVKVALQTGSTSESTAALVQSLLKLEAESALSRPAASQRPQSGSRKPAKKSTPVGVLKDEPKALSERHKYAFATEVVNICLKTLTDALKESDGSQPKHAPSKKTSPSRPTTERALQPRSGNSSPVRTQRKGLKDDAKSARTSLTPGRTSEATLHTAECAHHAFNYLRSVNAQQSHAHEQPKWQLENGTLAFVGRLIAHGLDSLAIKELRYVKRKIEFQVGPPTRQKADKPGSSVPQEKETLPTMLHLNCAQIQDLETRAVAILYHSHLLKVILSSKKLAVIEDAARFLELDLSDSPAALIIRQGKESGDNMKAARQLEQLSRTIMSLCSNGNPTASSPTGISQRRLSPQTAFELHTTALRIRCTWWDLAHHKPELSKELLDPFAKCAMAFLRTSNASTDAKAAYDVIARSYQDFRSFNSELSTLSEFNCLSILSTAAEGARDDPAARDWANQMVEVSDRLEENHALRAAAIARSCLLVGKHGSQEANLQVLIQLLRLKMSGTSLHHDTLLMTLGNLAYLLADSSAAKDASSRGIFFALTATYAIHYTQRYTEKNISAVQKILMSAILSSKSADELFSWVTADAAEFFIRQGTLSSIAKVANTKALSYAWASSSEARALSQILQTIVLKGIRSHADSKSIPFFDDEKLESTERGTILELQLTHLLSLANKAKYHDARRRMLPMLLDRLRSLYDATHHPLRRARVATIVLRIIESDPETLCDEELEPWRTASLDNYISGDEGLCPFREDIEAGLKIAQVFSNRQPSVDDLRPELLIWERIISTAEDAAHICERILDPTALARQLNSIAMYLAMLGEDSACLATRTMLAKLTTICNSTAIPVCDALADLAAQQIHMDMSKRADATLQQVEQSLEKQSASTRTRLHCQITRGEYLTATGDLKASHKVLEEAYQRQESQALTTRKQVTSALLYARAWLVHSNNSFQSGCAQDALHAALRCVSVLNGIWSEMETARNGGKISPTLATDNPTVDSEVQGLAKGISKLDLSAANPREHGDNEKKGASFWPIVPLLCRALLHTSEMYSHHGIFPDSEYYSKRAVQIAEAVGSTKLLSRVQSHRSCLLALAGRVEDAELLLTRDEGLLTTQPSLALVERYAAQAFVQNKAGSFDKAVELYEKAEGVIDVMRSKDLVDTLDTFGGPTDRLRRDNDSQNSQRQPVVGVQPKGRNTKVTPNAVTKGATKPARRDIVRKADAKTRAVSNQTRAAEENIDDSSCLLQKRKTAINIRKALIQVQQGHDVQSVVDDVRASSLSLQESFHARTIQSEGSLRAAIKILEKDVVLSSVADSTLCMPSLDSSTSVQLAVHSTPAHQDPKAAGSKTVRKAGPKSTKKDVIIQAGYRDHLRTAQATFLHDNYLDLLGCGTAQAHVTASVLLKATILLHAMSKPTSFQTPRCGVENLMVDVPRILAAQHEHTAAIVESQRGKTSAELLTWPDEGAARSLSKTPTASQFQEDFVDILPKSWTAVSICLNTDANELYIARHNAGQRSLVLRLPFSRHQVNALDEMEEESFDFHRAKAELQEIIDLSNYSCHNPGDLEGKALKSKWWSEREALDRRLHELLINIENMWLGGFKSIFAPAILEADPIEQFGKALEDILDQYLPSRKATKRSGERVSLDKRVLELFAGLAYDEDGSEDLDEPLTDLLYFVVDMLQFSGERNAYDEIDFDSMTIDVLDALRRFHDSVVVSEDSHEHLVLVLDRRLQAFPWESLPCLEGQNVSRVASMLSLRECILAQRASLKTTDGSKDNIPTIPATGTYILNPASNLPRTEATLSPTLSDMPSEWNAIVNKEPDSEQFSSAISTSSILLYFGHGGGSQYICPRAIRRLSTCCNVAWLMGCSSGAVTEHGDLEPSAVPLAYLSAGKRHDDPGTGEGPVNPNVCKAVVATLWDVTDRDIDRFSLRLGEEWGLWRSSEKNKMPAKTPRKREVVAAASTPQRAPKTPKTPKVRKSPPPPFKTPLRGHSKPPGRRAGKTSIVEAVSRSRRVCYLRYLNGAAPVVYGIPVYLEG